MLINGISDTNHLLPLFRTLYGHIHTVIIMPYLDIIKHLFTLLWHILIVSYSDPQFSLHGFNVACVLDRYEKIITFPQFSSNYNHVLTTGGSYICFQHRINSSCTYDPINVRLSLKGSNKHSRHSPDM